MFGYWNFLSSAVSHIIYDPVKPRAGAILRCDLGFGTADHTGIYVGRGQIVELQGNGWITRVSADEFKDCFCGTALSIYAACDSNARILSSTKIANRAKKMCECHRDYNVLLDNCNQFTAGCLTGDFDNGCSFLWMLESVIKDELNGGDSICWRVCDF